MLIAAAAAVVVDRLIASIDLVLIRVDANVVVAENELDSIDEIVD